MTKERIRKIQRIAKMINQNKRIAKITKITQNKSKEKIIKNRALLKKKMKRRKVQITKVQQY